MHLITSAKITMADVRFVENTSPPKLLTCSYVCQAVPALTTMEEWSPNMKGGSTVDIIINIKVVIIFWVVLELSKLSILSIITTSSLSSSANRPRSEDKRNRWVIIVGAGYEHCQNMSIKLHSCQNIDAGQSLMEQIQGCVRIGKGTLTLTQSQNSLPQGLCWQDCRQ